MSTTREVTVWCDTMGCYAWTYGAGHNHTAKEARRGAREEGWKHRDGRDLCPDCAAGRLPNTPSGQTGSPHYGRE